MGRLLKRIDGIKVLRRTRPGECGGTDAYQDTKAPTTIKSKEMVLFEAASALGRDVSSGRGVEEAMDFVSAFAAPSSPGTFLFLETGCRHRRDDGPELSWALIREDLFPELTDLVADLGLAKKNGFHSTTHGLPKNFGGSVSIKYASGEKISFSNNQSPILSFDAGKRIADLFREAMSRERIPLPDVSSLSRIRFYEKRSDGFTEAVLTLDSDGAGTNRKRSQYLGTQVFESENPVDREAVAAIKRTIEETGLLAQRGLPRSEYKGTGCDKILTFFFVGGEVITVDGGRVRPPRIGDGFFDVELEMTTRHRSRESKRNKGGGASSAWMITRALRRSRRRERSSGWSRSRSGRSSWPCIPR